MIPKSKNKKKENNKNNTNKKQNREICLNSRIFITSLGFLVTAIGIVKNLTINLKSFEPNEHGQLTLNGPQQQLIQQQQQLQQQQNQLQELKLKLEQHKQQQYNVSSLLSSSSSRQRCIMHNNHLDNMLEKKPQLFLVMTAKAGGTSVTTFAKECSKVKFPGKILSYGQGAQMRTLITAPKHPAKVVSSHIKSSETLLNLIHYSSQTQTTIFYIYRDETDRLLSAIKHIVTTRLCMPNTHRMFKLRNHDFGLEYNETSLTCKFDEEPFIKHAIQGQLIELSFHIYGTLTCDVWEAINKYSPKIVFVHYKQLNHLQEKISKYYCPQVSPKTLNVARIDVQKNSTSTTATATTNTNTTTTTDDNDNNDNNSIYEENETNNNDNNNNIEVHKIRRRLRRVSHEDIIKKMTISVKRKNHTHDKEIVFSEWLQERGSLLEYGLHLYPPSQTQCRNKIRTMHESLAVCPMVEIMPPTTLW